ncbi:MAG: TetR/AcrR family transcriptional regulator [Deltaproteobacteria bacterium]|nr:MAG: TetR/AcrR family transcriptional regulator [Deltaproteobacteria bacterium]
MARPRRDAHDVATTERILEAAERHFATYGREGARLADIAEDAGIRRSSLLYHFGSKDALYEAVVHRVFLRLGATLQEAMQAPGSLAERIDRIVDRFQAFLAEEPALAPVFLRELLAADGPGHALLLREVTPILDSIEAFALRVGGDALRPGLPVRAAVMQVASGILLAAAAGPAREPLFGEADHARTLARLLFLRDPEVP